MQKADFFALSILVCVVAACGKRSRFCTPSDFTAKSYRLFDEIFRRNSRTIALIFRGGKFRCPRVVRRLFYCVFRAIFRKK